MEANFSIESWRKNNFQNFIKTSQECFSQIINPDMRFISEGWYLIADVLQINDVLNLNGMLVTVDIQKAFDSVINQFLTLAWKKYGFGKTFIKWIKALLNKQKSCIINGRITRGGDPISGYLFILVLEIVFNLIK